MSDDPWPHEYVEPDDDYTIWVSRDGRRTPLIEMSQEHLENTFAFLERKQIARARGEKVSGSGKHAPMWQAAISAELERRRELGLLIDTRVVSKSRRSGASARLQRDWRWNGRPLRVKITIAEDGRIKIAWLRWFDRRQDVDGRGRGEWREWRAYCGPGPLRAVIEDYSDAACEWRGRSSFA